MKTICEVCGIEKRDEDTHWKMLSVSNKGATFHADEWNAVMVEVYFTTFRFACGEQHALILFERWLATKTFEPGPQKRAQVSA